MQAMDTNQLMTKYYQGLSSSERALMRSIMRLDNSVKQLEQKISEYSDKIEKLKHKYVNSFRNRNPDLRHFKAEQIRDFTDMLVKESQNLRSPNSVILVAGGVLFIFFGTFSLSILIARVFYANHQIEMGSSEVYLKQASHVMKIGFDSMIDKLASVSGSVFAVLLFKPLIYG